MLSYIGSDREQAPDQRANVRGVTEGSDESVIKFREIDDEDIERGS